MKTLGIALSISIVLLFLQLEVATLISTPHIRSMANQIIRFNTTNEVSENSVSGVIAHMCFFLCLWPFIGLSYLRANSQASALCDCFTHSYVFLQISAEQLQVCESKLEAKDKDVEKTGLHSSKESNP